MVKINAYFDDDMVLHICPANIMEAVFLEYYQKELQKHGANLIKIETDTKVYDEIKAITYVDPKD